MSWDTNAFKEKLESQHSFPGSYIFKFIVPKDKVELVKALWPEGNVVLKPSSKGKYVSVTIDGFMQNSDEVISVYTSASKIEGCIAL